MIGISIEGAAIDAFRLGAFARLENRQSFSWVPIIKGECMPETAHVQVDNTPLAAHRLKTIRKNRGLSQSSFAKQLGVTLRSYQYYENGERPLPGAVFAGLAKIGISIHWLITGEGEMNAPLREEVAQLEALVNYWEANYLLLEANINKTRVVIKERYGESVAAELCDKILPALEVSVKFPHPAGKAGVSVAVAENSKSKETQS